MSPRLAEKQIVVSIDDMDDETFLNQHMMLRHKDSLAGMTEWIHISEYVTGCYRSFHERLHATRVDLPHEHVA